MKEEQTRRRTQTQRLASRRGNRVATHGSHGHHTIVLHIVRHELATVDIALKQDLVPAGAGMAAIAYRLAELHRGDSHRQ